jgi:hypothetical protein
MMKLMCCRRLKQKHMIIIEAEEGGEEGTCGDEDGGGGELCSAGYLYCPHTPVVSSEQCRRRQTQTHVSN